MERNSMKIIKLSKMKNPLLLEIIPKIVLLFNQMMCLLSRVHSILLMINGISLMDIMDNLVYMVLGYSCKHLQKL